MHQPTVHYTHCNNCIYVFLGKIQTLNLDFTPALKQTMMVVMVMASAKKKTRVLLTRYVFQKLNLTHSNRARFAGGNCIRFLCGWAEQGIRTKRRPKKERNYSSTVFPLAHFALVSSHRNFFALIPQIKLSATLKQPTTTATEKRNHRTHCFQEFFVYYIIVFSVVSSQRNIFYIKPNLPILFSSYHSFFSSSPPMLHSQRCTAQPVLRRRYQFAQLRSWNEPQLAAITKN